MPNWCSNCLSITGSMEEIKNLIDLLDKGEGDFDFNMISPYPKEFADMDKANYGSGYINGGYDWRIENWGTKWNPETPSRSNTDTSISVYFVTAWSPPTPLITKLAELFPKLEITLQFEEGGCDFSGVYKFAGGVLVERLDGEYHEYSDDDEEFDEFEDDDEEFDEFEDDDGINEQNSDTVSYDIEELIIELSPNIVMEFVHVPAGEFLMGSNKWKDKQADDDEKPQHKVRLNEYWIGKYPVTNKQFEAFVKETGHQTEAEKAGSDLNWQYPSLSGLSEHPVVHVSWNDAKAFCEWAGLRLPSEAEWEKAARGTDGRTYPWGEGIDRKRANYEWAVGSTTAVGQYEDGKSPYGAYDMAGNVWEWVEDWYAAYPGNTVSDSDYGETKKVLRGGSCYGYDYNTRSALRYRDDASFTLSDVGFRCVRSN